VAIGAATLVVALAGVTACTGNAAAPDPCDSCGDGQVCVQFFDDTCTLRNTGCRTATVACPEAACTPGCETEICQAVPSQPWPYVCNLSACPGQSDAALHCYGP